MRLETESGFSSFAQFAILSLMEIQSDTEVWKPGSEIQGENEGSKERCKRIRSGTVWGGQRKRRGTAFCSCCLGSDDQCKFRSPGKINFAVHNRQGAFAARWGRKRGWRERGSCLPCWNAPEADPGDAGQPWCHSDSRSSKLRTYHCSELLA